MSTGNDSLGMILMYHRIAEVDLDPWDLCVTPRNFDAHLKVLREKGLDVKPVDQINNLGLTPSVAVTFDDGYVDNYIYAKPLLEKFEIPATFFIISGSVGVKGEFWWDYLETLIVRSQVIPNTIKLEINGEIKRWDIGQKTINERMEIYKEAWEVFSKLSTIDRAKNLTILRDQVQACEIDMGRLPMSAEQVKDLNDGGLIEIASHTARHPFLGRLSTQEQKEEITDSKKSLEEILNKTIKGVSLPHGSHNEYTVSLIKEAGYEWACTSINENVKENTDKFLLPRRVVINWKKQQFEQKIEEWLSE